MRFNAFQEESRDLHKCMLGLSHAGPGISRAVFAIAMTDDDLAPTVASHDVNFIY